MTRTKIEYCTHTANPLRARKFNPRFNPIFSSPNILGTGHYCEKVSEECRNCYASKWQPRFGMPEFAEQRARRIISPDSMSAAALESGASEEIARPRDIEVYLDEVELQKILRHRKPARIFWNDMSDWAGHWVRDEWIDQMLAVVALTPHITHMWLTKRSKRMREYFDACTPDRRLEILERTEFQWPLPNLWLGVSVGNQQAADERIPDLLATPAAVRFLSCEPLIGSVNLRSNALMEAYGHDRDILGYPGLHWAIVGGESGTGARPTHPDWFRSLRDQAIAAGARYFHKQNGEWLHMTQQERSKEFPRIVADGANGCPPGGYPESRVFRWPDGSESYRVGKANAGRLLDGREWNELPEVKS